MWTIVNISGACIGSFNSFDAAFCFKMKLDDWMLWTVRRVDEV